VPAGPPAVHDDLEKSKPLRSERWNDLTLFSRPNSGQNPSRSHQPVITTTFAVFEKGRGDWLGQRAWLSYRSGDLDERGRASPATEPGKMVPPCLADRRSCRLATGRPYGGHHCARVQYWMGERLVRETRPGLREIARPRLGLERKKTSELDIDGPTLSVCAPSK